MPVSFISTILILILSFHFTSFAAEELKKCRLFIETLPENSRIRVLNIKPKFKQGIDLKPGKYLIEVSARGYETKEIWTSVKAGEEKKIIISIKKKISQIPEAQSPGPPQKPIFKKNDSKENEENDTDILKKGHFYRDRGEYKKAIAYYLKNLRLNPYKIETFYCLGFAYLKLGNTDKAKEYFKQAVKIDPYNADSYYSLGLVYFIIEDKDSAVEQHEKLKALDKVLAAKLSRYIDILE